MDPDVDKQYKQKYFPLNGTAITATRVVPSEELYSGYSIQEYHTPSTSHHPDPLSILTTTLNTLTLTLLTIEPEDPSKPCYLSHLPDELFLDILLHLSLSSLFSLTSTSLVCKKLLSFSHGENSLYKRLCYHYFRTFSSY
jgi:hypothetical protein